MHADFGEDKIEELLGVEGGSGINIDGEQVDSGGTANFSLCVSSSSMHSLGDHVKMGRVASTFKGNR